MNDLARKRRRTRTRN